MLQLNREANNTLYGSSVVNGQLVSNFTWRAMLPSQAAAPYWYGNGSKPATLAGFSAPVGANVMSSAAGSGVGIGGGDLSAAAGESPFDARLSPTVWAIGFLIIGLLGLRHIHWRAE